MKFVALLLTTLTIASGQQSDPALPEPPGKLVDLEGRRVHLHCMGSGSPTVVLEAGASAFAIDWALVQPEVARTNRVCSYDRAGHGWSDTRPQPDTPARIVRDLRALLAAAGEKAPYVLVGASKGGIYVRLYHADFPDDVAGIVLVDPTHEDGLFTMLQGKGVAISSLTAEQMRSTIPAGPANVPRGWRSPQTGAPFDRLPPELYKTRIRLDTRLIDSVPPQVPYDVVLEVAEGDRASLARLHEITATRDHPLGDRPVVVLSRGDRAADGLHAALARLSTNSRHTVVAGAGHEIHLFEPRAVIQAITDVVGAVRNGTSLASPR